MPSNDLYLKCRTKADELLEKYFPNFSHEVGVVRPEELDPEYNDQLPEKVQAEFRDWLRQLWQEVAPSGAKSFDEAMNLDERWEKMKNANAEDLERARSEAERRSGHGHDLQPSPMCDSGCLHVEFVCGGSRRIRPRNRRFW